MPKPFRLSRALTFLVLGLAALLLSAWALAVFWLPDFARHKAEQVLGEALHRQVSIGAIDLAPMSLAVTLREVSVAQREAQPGVGPLVAFDEFHLDLSGDSVWQRAPIVSALRLKGPRVHLVREADGRFNFADLLGPGKSEDKPDAPLPAQLPNFSLANVEVSGGQLIFDDRLKQSRQVVSELAFGIPFAGTLGAQEESWVKPHFRARVDGSLIELSGKVKPFTDRREATLEVRLKDLDLTRIDEYVPLGPDLKLRSARLDLDLDLAFVQAPGKPLGLHVSGESALRKVAIENRGGAPYVLAAERLRLKLDEFDLGQKKPIKAALVVDALSLGPRNGKATLLSLPKLEASGASIDLAGKRVELAALRLDGLRLVLRREADGQIDLVRLLQPPVGDKGRPGETPATGRESSHPQAPAVLQKTAAPAAVAPAGPAVARPVQPAASTAPAAALPPAAGKEPSAWSGRLGRLTFHDAGLRFVDAALAQAPQLAIEKLDFVAEAIEFPGTTPTKFKLAASVNQRGKLAITGSAGGQPLAVALAVDVRDVDLVPLQAWAGDKFNALLSRGAISLNGQLDLGGEPLVARFAGDGKLSGFNVFDRLNASDILNFRTVELSGVRVVSAPLSIELKRLTFDELFARVILGADGQLNLKQLVKSDAPPASPAAPLAPPIAERPRLPLRINEILVKKSSVYFSDRFIKPHYSASVTGLEGRIAPLADGQRGLIDLRGAVDRSAPLSIAGEVDPFGQKLFLNLAAHVKGVDMPSVSTYTERYLGYEVAKGKLSVDLNYLVDNGQLKADNRLFLDQLTLGNQVESPEAISAPVSLAISLLKNSRGEIDLKLPISGSLDDPEFSVGRVIWKTLGNLLIKAASSPFALLGSLFGEDAGEISQIEFVPGRAALEGDGEKRLRALAKALLDRPELRLDVTGHADPGADRAALAVAMLDRKLRARKLADSAQKGQDSVALRDIALSPEERAAYIEALARDEEIKLAKGSPTADYEKALLARIVVGDDELRQLAERRGRGVRNWLVDTGGVPVERVFVMVPRVDRAESAAASGRAVFALR
jgi:uncharacterized protein involved in outer membrane biogenesis